MIGNNNQSRLLGIECYRQAGEFVKAALYSFFLLNGGAITAILAKSSLNEITVHIFWFIGGIVAAVLSLVAAFLAINEAARLNGGYDVSPFSPYAPRVVFTKFFFITLFFALISLIAFLVGCIAVWETSK